MRHVLKVCAAVAVASVTCTLTFAVQPSFHGLGDLSGGPTYSRPEAVSNGGTVVVGTSGIAGNQLEGFRWTPEAGIQELPTAANDLVRNITDVTPDGSALFGWMQVGNPPSRVAEFRWTESAGFEYPLGIDEPPSSSADIFATYDGQTIATSLVVEGAGRQAIRYSVAAGLELLGDFPGGPISSEARDISGNGSTVVGYGNAAESSSPIAFRWTEAEGMQELGTGPNGLIPNFAEATSFDGSVVVGFGGTEESPASRAFRWSESEGIIFLPVLSGSGLDFAQALDVSADGSRIVGFDTSIGAFIWTKNSSTESLRTVLERYGLGISMAGWELTQAIAISPDGMSFAGIGFHSGNVEGWVATVPEPASIWLAVVGCCTIISAVNRAKRV